MNRISLSDRDRFVPKEGEVFFAEVPGKFILSIVVEDDIVDEFNNSCERCVFKDWVYPTDDCCSRNRCVDCLRDINLDDVYYKPLAEVTEEEAKKVAEQLNKIRNERLNLTVK
ncbi:hypothetical protein ACIXUO_19605 [Bacteroides fragilis]